MPAGPTYEPIATTTLGSNAATITFSSIAATYTDLRVVLVGRDDRASTGNDTVFLRFNSDTATNYSYTRLLGDGANASSAAGTSLTSNVAGFIPRNNNTSGIFGLVTVDIFSYAGSTNKTYLSTTSADLNGSGDVVRIVGLWRNTSAITSITFSLGSTFQYLTGTIATLYGIKNA
jgi:hypothetical protein